MNILITGANGFVGRTLTKRLRAAGHAVRGAVRSVSLNDMPEIETVAVGDCGSETEWTPALSGIATVIHLAARVHLMDDQAADPLAAFRLVNVAGTVRLARQAVQTGVKRLVFVSSIKVNGEESENPYHVNSPYNPQDSYAISKMEAELALRAIEQETGLEVVVVRPPLVYGTGVKANFLKMLQLVSKGVPLPLASIRNCRSLVSVGNLADALAVCAVHPAAAGQTYLVSDGEDVSTPKLIHQIALALGVPARLLPFPVSLMRLAAKLTGKSGALNRLTGSLTVDSSKIRRELDWKPPFTMEEGLQETAAWFNKRQT
jgi:nucleoside-diphosphate-sugar epimerase